MKITFTPLAESHFPLLLKWLETPHVKAWWGQDVKWTPELIRKKYTNYVEGYKLENGIAKTIKACIICVDSVPIGYIQIYNAYDFARSKPLTGLPSNLAAFDVLIGEESYLKQGLGSQAIEQCLKEHGNSYTHVFADPENTNLAAIRAYEKAGFKKIKEQSDTGEQWMIREQTGRPDPLCTIQKLVQERYSNAKAIFWAGSVSQDQGTSTSDLDLVIVFDAIPHAYREAFVYDGWPIDAFIHDTDTLRYFFEESRAGNGISGLSYMILNGRIVTDPSAFSENIKTLAQKVLNTGPAVWDKKQIDNERFLITDVLDDIKCPASRDEQIASAAWLFEALGQFYFRSQNKWCASGKSMIRYLKKDNPGLAVDFTEAFESLFQTGSSVPLESLANKILAPYDGLFWDGYKSDAPKDFRTAETSHEGMKMYLEQSDAVSGAGKSHHLLIRRFVPNVRLLPATIADYPTIQNMARFYVYDRTAYMGWECPEGGLFECIDFKHYFENPDEKAFLVRVSDEIAGFVLLDKMPVLEPVDWNMGEFFILAKFQGKGIANTVAREILQKHPGKWSIAVMPENIKAVKFWRKIISDISKGDYTEIFKTKDELKTAENPEPYAMNVFTFDTHG